MSLQDQYNAAKLEVERLKADSTTPEPVLKAAIDQQIKLGLQILQPSRLPLWIPEQLPPLVVCIDPR